MNKSIDKTQEALRVERALKLALEALEAVTKEMLAIRDEIAERGGRPKTNAFHQRLWDSSFAAYTDKAIPAAEAIREALAEQSHCDDCGGFDPECPLAQPAQQQEPDDTDWGAVLEKLIEVWNRQISADEGLNEIQDLIYTSPPASNPLTDEMAVDAARMLSDRQAAACNVDCGDMWKMHGNDFIEDARAALEAAHGIKENT